MSAVSGKWFLALMVLGIILGTTLVFHATQDFYKAFAVGEQYYLQKRYAESLPYLKEVFQMDSQHPKVIHYLLRTYEKLGMKIELKNLLERVWRTNPENLEITRELADAYYGALDFAKAEELYRRILTKRPANDVRKRLAEVLVWQRKYEEAIPVMDALGSEFAQDPEWKKFSADAYAWAKKFDRAAELYQEILRENPDSMETARKLADTLRYAGRDEEAVRVYEQYLTKGNPA